MMTKDEALRMCVEALEKCIHNTPDYATHMPSYQRAFAVAREALAEQPAAPRLANSEFESLSAQLLQAAWIDGWGCCRDSEYAGSEAMHEAFNSSDTLSLCLKADHPTEQPAAPAVLTTAEIDAVWSSMGSFTDRQSDYRIFARAILARAIPPGCVVVPIAGLNKAIAYSEPGHARDTLQALLPEGSALAARPGAPK